MRLRLAGAWLATLLASVCLVAPPAGAQDPAADADGLLSDAGIGWSDKDDLPAVAQPDPSKQPVFDRLFAPLPDHRGIAVGDGYLYRLEGNHVRRYDATTLQFVNDSSRELLGPGLITAYRHKIYVTDWGCPHPEDLFCQPDSKLIAFDKDLNLLWETSLPTTNPLTVTREGSQPLGPFGGMDIANGEIWLSKYGDNPPEATVLVLGADGGGFIAAMAQPARDRCSTGGTCPTQRYSRFYDIALAPETNDVIVDMQPVQHGLLAQTTLPSALAAASSAPMESHRLYEVRGMRWLLEQQQGRVSEYSIDPAPITTGITHKLTLRRQWLTNQSEYMDIAYSRREARLDWSGESGASSLTGGEWLKGVRCLDYVVSDGDIFLDGTNVEHWWEQARNFSGITLSVDGVNAPLVAPSTDPLQASGKLCIDTTKLGNGKHTLTATATVGGKAVTRTNSDLSVDNGAPTGAVDALPQYGRGTVTVTGALADAHSGPRDWGLQVSGPSTGGSWRAVCPPQDTPSATGDYSCAWDTTAYADGTYQVRAVLRDLVSPGYGGPNTAAASPPQGSILVDNSPPDVSNISPAVGSELSDTVVAGPAEVLLTQTDAGSGADHTDLDYNTATDGTANGGWVPAGTIAGSGENDTLWDTGSVEDGLHRMRATSYDRAGNTRSSEWQVTVASSKCSVGHNPHCYGGYQALGGKVIVGRSPTTYVPGGSGVRARLSFPTTFPSSTSPGWSVGFVATSGTYGAGRNMEAGAANNNGCGGPTGKGYFVFGVWTPRRAPQKYSCIKDSNGDPYPGDGREYVAVIDKNGRSKMLYSAGGHLHVAHVGGASSYAAGHKGWELGAYGETNTHGRQIVGSWAGVRYNPNPSGGGWATPTEYQEARYGSGYGKTDYDSRHDYFCVHGPNRTCTPPHP